MARQPIFWRIISRQIFLVIERTWLWIVFSWSRAAPLSKEGAVQSTSWIAFRPEDPQVMHFGAASDFVGWDILPRKRTKY